jgi:hypothetical protein
LVGSYIICDGNKFLFGFAEEEEDIDYFNDDIEYEEIDFNDNK